MKKLVYILLFIFISVNSFGQKNDDNMSIELTSINVYPNPFNENTKISFYSSQNSLITFIVQDVLGNIVKSEKILLNKGENTIPFYKKKLSSGIYIYSLKTKDNIISKRFVIK